MKKVLISKAVIVQDDVVVLNHPTTVFTDDNIPVNQFDNELIVEGLKSMQVDSVINQIAEKEIQVEVIWLEDLPRTTDSDAAVVKLIEKGTTVITVE